MKRSILYSPNSFAQLEAQGCLKPQTERSQKTVFATLLLTPLVDAFSILVIYLMVSTTNGTEIEVLEKIQLPEAQASSSLQTGTLVSLLDQNFVVDEEVVRPEQLLPFLKDLHAKLAETKDPRSKKLIFQADRKQQFKDINPIILAGTQSGFEEIVFAVIQNPSASGVDR